MNEGILSCWQPWLIDLAQCTNLERAETKIMLDKQTRDFDSLVVKHRYFSLRPGDPDMDTLLLPICSEHERWGET